MQLSNSQPLTVRLGVDVGGTFTDLVLFDPASNRLEFAKTASTPENQALGVESGIRKVTQQCNVGPRAIAFLAHGTTVATNALLERRGASCALLVTEGFRDRVYGLTDALTPGPLPEVEGGV